MKTSTVYGLLSMLACIVTPYLSRIPRGREFFMQYVAQGEDVISGNLFFVGLALIPGVVTLGFWMISRKPLFLPGLLSTSCALIALVLCHQGNDLSIDAQAALSLVVFPILTAMIAVIAGLIGLAIQYFRSRKNLEG